MGPHGHSSSANAEYTRQTLATANHNCASFPPVKISHCDFGQYQEKSLRQTTASDLHERASQRLLSTWVREHVVAAASPTSLMPLRAPHSVHSIMTVFGRPWLGQALGGLQEENSPTERHTSSDRKGESNAMLALPTKNTYRDYSSVKGSCQLPPPPAGGLP